MSWPWISIHSNTSVALKYRECTCECHESIHPSHLHRLGPPLQPSPSSRPAVRSAPQEPRWWTDSWTHRLCQSSLRTEITARWPGQLNENRSQVFQLCLLPPPRTVCFYWRKTRVLGGNELLGGDLSSMSASCSFKLLLLTWTQTLTSLTLKKANSCTTILWVRSITDSVAVLWPLKDVLVFPTLVRCVYCLYVRRHW